MKKEILFNIQMVSLLIIITSLFLISCSYQNQITGEVIKDQTSLLQVKVVNEARELLPEVEIYSNNIFKGKTSSFGENLGTKLVILEGSSNVIYAEKEGYFSSTPISISAIAVGGEQQITFTLEKKRTSFLVQVINLRNRELPGALVSLYGSKRYVTVHEQPNFPPLQTIFTDAHGQAELEKVEDGNYFITINVAGYEETVLDQQEASLAKYGTEQNLRVVLKKTS